LEAIDRCLGDPAAPDRSVDDDTTGQHETSAAAGASVSLDPELAAEIRRLPQRAHKAEPLTPVPRVRPPRPAAAPPPAEAPPAEALRNEERLGRALQQAVEVLAVELERRLRAQGREEGAQLSPSGALEMGRLARRVARQLGMQRRAVDEIGVAAQLFLVDR